MAEGADILQEARELARFAMENAASLSDEAQQIFLQFLESLPPLGEPLPEIPDNAKLLWEMAGADPETFVQYVVQYQEQSPDLSTLLQDPARMVSTIEQLQSTRPQRVREDVEDGIPEATLPSSNVWGFAYNPDDSKLYVKYNGKDVKDDGPVYEYDNVPGVIYNVFASGAVPAKTSGKNKWGTWFKGKNPSLGAAANQLLKIGGFPYRRVS